MEVTKDNFFEIYPTIREQISKAIFISIDEEFSGISIPNEREFRNRKDDTPEKRYSKMKDVAERYSIIQFGLCIYCFDENGCIISYPYNFYVFPESGRDIVLSASSMDFLRKNNMDFGKWMSKGINYCDEETDTYYYKKYIQSHQEVVETSETKINKKIILTKPSDIEFMNLNFDRLNAHVLSQMFSIEEFKFDQCNSYLRRYIYQTIETDYPNIILRALDGNPNVLQAFLVTEEDKRTEKLVKIKVDEENYNRNLGFRLLFKDIISAKMYLVGHNLMFDLMFMYRSFVGPLPLTLSEFKKCLSSMFRGIFDTKYIIESKVLGITTNDSSLGELYKYFQNIDKKDSITIKIAEGFASKIEQFHDAAFDAYCTGYIFAQEIMILMDDSIEIMKEDEYYFLKAFDIIKDLSMNKLFMMQSVWNIDLSEQNVLHGDIKVDGYLLYISEFDVAVTNDSILEVIKTDNFAISNIEVFWIDDISLMLNIKTSEDIDMIISRIVDLKGWKVLEYSELIKLNENDSLKKRKTNESNAI